MPLYLSEEEKVVRARLRGVRRRRNDIYKRQQLLRIENAKLAAEQSRLLEKLAELSCTRVQQMRDKAAREKEKKQQKKEQET